MSISINTIGQTMAMEGRMSPARIEGAPPEPKATFVMPDPETVAQRLVDNSSALDESMRELQKLADSMDRRVQFNVNKELGRVVVKIVDPSTDKVIKEIPSADIQKLQIRIKETLGLLFDKQI